MKKLKSVERLGYGTWYYESDNLNGFEEPIWKLYDRYMDFHGTFKFDDMIDAIIWLGNDVDTIESVNRWLKYFG